MKYYIILLMSVMVLTSCFQTEIPQQEDVWVPIYEKKEIAKEVTLLAPHNTVNGGKIYSWENYFFQLEPLKGIHVFERTSTTAIKKYFIQVLGAQEISIKDGFLYTNNYSDLITIDISNWDNINVTSRIENAIQMEMLHTPPSGGYFQCVDTSKGVIVGWELQHNIPANCKN